MTEDRFTKQLNGEDAGSALHEPLGVVFGWGAVSTVKDEDGVRRPYYDKGWTGKDGQRYHDHITEDAILRASLDYALGNRPLGERHQKSAALRALESALSAISDADTSCDSRNHAIHTVQAIVSTQPASLNQEELHGP